MEVHLHNSDQGAMAISPNNGAFLLNMSQPISSFTLVIRSLQDTGKIGVFQVNIINREGHESESMQNLITSMQSISYLEHISDLAAEVQKDDNETLVQKLRQKYFTDITTHVENWLKE